MKKLALYPVEKIDQLTSPEAHEDISVQSSALNVFTDFKKVTPMVIESTTSAVNVEHLMQKSHVRLKLVIDHYARIGDVIETLQSAGQQHCLVIDREQHAIRGVLSANDIARRLKLAVDVSTPNSFASIFKVIANTQQPAVLQIPQPHF